MKAFVTGGTGFVGSHLVERLLAEGHDVTALVRSQPKADRLFGARAPHYLRGSLHDTDVIARGAGEAEVVYHLAALTAALGWPEFHRVNVQATEKLLAATAGRFVFVSSFAAAGPSEPGRPLRGTEPARPVTPYGRSKRAAEEAVERHAGEWTIVRPPTVYGPRDVELLRVFKLARWGLAPVFGTGAQELSLIHVDDLVAALLAATAVPTRKSWFVAHPETVTSRELVTAIGREVRGKAPWILPIPGFLARGALMLTGAAARLAGKATLLSPDKAPEFLAPAWTADPKPFETAAGWKAAMNLERGLEHTASWYRRHGWL
ncbi:MAG: NAD(P)-dependent oxidoreductase [Gemmatimonadales bacterium]